MIAEILNEQRIRIPLQGSTKEEVLVELVDLLKLPGDNSQQQILRKSLEREGRMSTGSGKGVALPRYRGKDVTGIWAAFGIKPEGINFHALDGSPVRFLFFIAAGEKEEEGYVEALSRMARILNQEDFLDHLLREKSPEKILALLRQEEEELWK